MRNAEGGFRRLDLQDLIRRTAPLTDSFDFLGALDFPEHTPEELPTHLRDWFRDQGDKIQLRSVTSYSCCLGPYTDHACQRYTTTFLSSHSRSTAQPVPFHPVPAVPFFADSTPSTPTLTSPASSIPSSARPSPPPASPTSM